MFIVLELDAALSVSVEWQEYPTAAVRIVSSCLSDKERKQLMPFPESSRVVYSRNPLIEVISQLRFPAVLRVDTELPVSFQDRIRATYPIFEQKQISQVSGVPELLAAAIAPKLKPAYEFLSDDKTWKVTLTRESVALSTTSYERWEVFRDRLTEVLTAHEAVYSPQFLTRIGLRYRDALERGPLRLEDVRWSELLSPFIAAELGADALQDRVVELAHNSVIDIGDQARVRLQHGIAQNEATMEEAYLIDADLFTETKTGVGDALNVLDRFNQIAGRLFRWCISDRLHEAMGPVSIPE